MSFSRSYNATISGTTHTTVTYPASEGGGSMDVAAHWSEDVFIDIEVDTRPFDHSVGSLKHHVDALTAAMVATEAAQVHEKSVGADKVAGTITDGFFRLIRSEISQQTAGLKSKIDSLLLKLNDIKLACQKVQQSMQLDYSRITERYAKLFDELDRETKARVTSLDADALSLRSRVSEEVARSAGTKLCTMATIGTADTVAAQNRLLAATIRSVAHGLLVAASNYLAEDCRVSKDMRDMLVEGESSQQEVFVPVLFAVTDNHQGAKERTYSPGFESLGAQALQNPVASGFNSVSTTWQPMDAAQRAQIERFLIPRIENIKSTDGQHASRVKAMAIALWQNHVPQVAAPANPITRG